MKRLFIATVLLVGACGAPHLKPTVVHASDMPCPEHPAAPRPLPHVRTPQRIGEYATEVELAREAERHRGDQCAGSLADLLDLAVRNGWIVLQ